jgi:hypothetical protein
MMPDVPHTVYGQASLSDMRRGKINDYSNMRGAIYARVLRVNWASHTIDCIGLHNYKGSGPWFNVPVLKSVFTQTEGVHWMPTIAPPTKGDNQANAYLEGEDDALAIVDFVSGDIKKPVCLGFITPGAHELSFADEGVKIERHNSDVYSRLTSNGTYEFAFPDGTYIKIAPESEGYGLKDLSAMPAKDAGKRQWNISSDEPRVAIVSHPSGTSITIDKDGNVSIHSAQSISLSTSNGSISLNTPRNSFSVD